MPAPARMGSATRTAVAATSFTAKIKWASTQNILATGYKYSLWFQSSGAAYTGGKPDPLSNRRRIPARFNGRFNRSGGTAACTVTLVNSTSSYV